MDGESVRRAVAAGYLVLPDRSVVGASICGTRRQVIRFNPETPSVATEIDALVSAATRPPPLPPRPE